MGNRRHFELKGKAAERVLHDLAVKTFLTDWCYPNPRLPDGKELCDLLVVFDDMAVVWQVKDLKLQPDGRYKAAEVEKNLRQLLGARRQLVELKTPLQLENPRRGREPFDPSTIRQIFLIGALLGEGEELFNAVEAVGDRTIHTFDAEFTELVLRELDTISDFTAYLRATEALLASNTKLLIVGGEQELLAFYLMNDRQFERLKKADHVVIEEGSWRHLQDKPEYKAKKNADEVSYGWDSIIDRAHEGSREYELVARELARPNRFMRRYLSKVFFDAHGEAHKDIVHDMYRRVFVAEGVTYCFLFGPEPRERRREILRTLCFVARGKFAQNKKVLGIATEKKIEPTCSYDFGLMMQPEWTASDQKRMEEIQRHTGILRDPTISPTNEDEYPRPTG